MSPPIQSLENGASADGDFAPDPTPAPSADLRRVADLLGKLGQRLLGVLIPVMCGLEPGAVVVDVGADLHVRGGEGLDHRVQALVERRGAAVGQRCGTWPPPTAGPT